VGAILAVVRAWVGPAGDGRGVAVVGDHEERVL
jgi:hypothetical protein